jgi:hypothetical protein
MGLHGKKLATDYLYFRHGMVCLTFGTAAGKIIELKCIVINTNGIKIIGSSCLASDCYTVVVTF